MSIFSSIGSAIGSAYNAVKNTVSNIFGGGQSQSASAMNFNAGNNLSGYGAPIQPTGQQGATTYYNSYTPPNTTGYTALVPYSGLTGNVPAGTSFGTPLPVTISAGPQSTAKGGGSSGANFLGISSAPFGAPSAPATTQAPVTISSRSLGASAPSGGGASSLSAPSGGGSSSPSPLVLPGNPSSVNPGGANTSGLAGGMSGYYKYNPATGTYEPVTNPTAETDQQTADKTKALYDSIVGVKPDVYSDPAVVQARQQRQQLQQDLLAPTSELNAIVAKQNQDLLQLRQTGSKEGVTEAVYGGQSNAINYNAAIRSLPLQAQIAAVQKNLDLAQSYLADLTTMKTAQINNQYDYNKNLFESISGAIVRKDERAYEQLKLQNDRNYQQQQDLIKVQDDLLKNAVSQKAPSSVINAINTATTRQQAIAAAGQYASPVQTSVVNSNGHQLLVNSNTGDTIKDLGTAPLNAYSFAGTPAGNILAQAIASGQIAPSSVNSRNASILANVLAVNPNFNAVQANAAANFFNNSGTQEKLAWSNSVTSNLDILLGLSAKVHRSDLKPINEAILAGKTLTGDVSTVQFVNAANRTAAELSKVLGDSGGSDFRTRLANNLLDPSYSPEQFAGAIATEKQLISSLQNSFYSQGGQSNPNTPSTGTAVTAPDGQQVIITD